MPDSRVLGPAAPSSSEVAAAARGTSIAFISSGFAFASWASRIPQVRHQLGLTPAQLGLVLLSIAAGSLIALPLGGPVIQRYGSRRTVRAMAVLLTIGLSVTAVGYRVGVVPVVGGLFLLGLANGAWDVAMNVQGALVERHLGRSIMPRFHAGWSLGTVGGALAGAAMVLLRVPVTTHLLVVAAVVTLVVPSSSRSFLQDAAGPAPRKDGSDGGAFAAWREPRTLLIGIFVLAFAFAEGTGNDWISVATIDGYRASTAVATFAFAVFLSAMTIGRWFGPGLLDRHGRVLVVRASSAIGMAGTLLFVFAPVLPLAFLGTALWGLGVSLGFPVGMSAGADDPLHSARRVSVIASIGYCAFLAGPPAVGFLGDHLTVLRAVTAVAVLLGLAALIGSVVTPLQAPDSDSDAK